MFSISRLGLSFAFIATLMSGCFGPIGNSDRDCRSGSTCECSGIGNCDRGCPGGNCNFVCRGTTNCDFRCEGGNCNALCANTGNCILECPGGGCDLTCDNTGNCICESGCQSDAAVRDAGTD